MLVPLEVPEGDCVWNWLGEGEKDCDGVSDCVLVAPCDAVRDCEGVPTELEVPEGDRVQD